MEKIATSFCAFEGLVAKYTYVDKTDMLWRLVSDSTDRKGALKRLLNWYGSYRFCPGSNVRVCNPISIAKSLATRTIQNYWAKTASASLVMERIEAAHKTPADFEGCESTADELDVCDALELPAKALMYQGGYLTIKKVVGEANGGDVQRLIRDGKWRHAFPEVRQVVVRNLADGLKTED